jgi:hypothetical protein
VFAFVITWFFYFSPGQIEVIRPTNSGWPAVQGSSSWCCEMAAFPCCSAVGQLRVKSRAVQVGSRAMRRRSGCITGPRNLQSCSKPCQYIGAKELPSLRGFSVALPQAPGSCPDLCNSERVHAGMCQMHVDMCSVHVSAWCPRAYLHFCGCKCTSVHVLYASTCAHVSGR